MIKFPPDDHTAVSATTTAAMLASTTEVEEKIVLRWRKNWSSEMVPGVRGSLAHNRR